MTVQHDVLACIPIQHMLQLVMYYVTIRQIPPKSLFLAVFTPK